MGGIINPYRVNFHEIFSPAAYIMAELAEESWLGLAAVNYSHIS